MTLISTGLPRAEIGGPGAMPTQGLALDGPDWPQPYQIQVLRSPIAPNLTIPQAKLPFSKKTHFFNTRSKHSGLGIFFHYLGYYWPSHCRCHCFLISHRWLSSGEHELEACFYGPNAWRKFIHSAPRTAFTKRTHLICIFDHIATQEIPCPLPFTHVIPWCSAHRSKSS